MSKYKIGDIVLCRRYNNIIGNMYMGEIVGINKLSRNIGKGWDADKTIALWCILMSLRVINVDLKNYIDMILNTIMVI
jgi:hypothetical protein